MQFSRSMNWVHIIQDIIEKREFRKTGTALAENI